LKKRFYRFPKNRFLLDEMKNGCFRFPETSFWGRHDKAILSVSVTSLFQGATKKRFFVCEETFSGRHEKNRFFWAL
jgi:hypothetical protein